MQDLISERCPQFPGAINQAGALLVVDEGLPRQGKREAPLRPQYPGQNMDRHDARMDAPFKTRLGSDDYGALSILICDFECPVIQ